MTTVYCEWERGVMGSCGTPSIGSRSLRGSFKVMADGSRHRRPSFAVLLLSSLVFINALSPPASADHPGYLPSYVGQYVAVVTEIGVECWIAEGLTGWLYWNPLPCPDQPGNEVEEVRSANGIVSGTLHVLSRIERFEGGQLATGADTGTLYNHQPYALRPGGMGNKSYLYAYDVELGAHAAYRATGVST